MVNFAAKVQKHRKSDLLPDEQVLAAVFGSPIGSAARLFGSELGALGAGVVAEAIVQTDEYDGAVQGPVATGSETMASRVGQKTVVAAVTDQRVLFFGHGALTGRPKRLLVSFEFDRIGDVGLQPGKFINNVRLQFDDTSVVEIEVTRLNDPEGFVKAWKAIRSR